jgi:DNA sulfur modification protein DndD
MKIKKVTLQNFRPFYGVQTLDLETEDTHPVVLIRADNDVGKTSLFRAVQFCLYGERSQETTARHVNRTAAYERNGTMSVKLAFSHENSSYEFTRKVEFERASPPSFPQLKEHSVLEVRKDGILERLNTQEEERDYVESILPEDASQFFLFDGEQIQRYTQHPPGEKVKGAIEMVLGVKELLNAREDLDKIEGEMSSELTKLLQEENKEKDEANILSELEQEINRLQAEVGDLAEKISGAKETVESCDRQLETFKELQEKVGDRIRAETEFNQVKDQIKANDEELRDFNRNLGPLLVAPLLNSFSQSMPDVDSAPDFERRTAQTVLTGGTCICGRTIDENCKERLSALAVQAKPGRLLQLKELAQGLLIEFEPKSLETQLYNLLNTKNGFESLRASLESNISALDKQLGTDAQELGAQINNTEDTRQRAARAQREYEDERNLKMFTWNGKTEELRTGQRKLASKTTSKNVTSKQNLLDICRKTREAMTDVIDRLVTERRNDVEKLASHAFRELTNNPRLYLGIKISEDYELEVVTIGNVVRKVWEQDPSAGASQVIATSFIAALNKYTAREAPVIIDTPIGRLDPFHKNQLIGFYPRIGPQVVILYQPSELTEDDIEKIVRNVASQWEFRHEKEKPDITRIHRLKGR